MLSLMTFGAGFLMRPVGAIILGAYIDRVGRRAGLLLTLGLMAVGTLLIACLPGYATIGFVAPFLILVSRLGPRLLGWCRTRRSVGLSVGNGHPGAQRILRQLAIR